MDLARQDREVACTRVEVQGAGAGPGSTVIASLETFVLDARRHLGTTGGHDPPVQEDVDEVGDELLEQPLVVRDSRTPSAGRSPARR